MARPTKNYCDYFPHERDMRNHRKIKALRTKFKITGYAIWNMLLEYLTGIDGNEFEKSPQEYELMAGDFGVSATEISEIVDYCIFLELLFEKDGFIHSESLDENLKPVYEKRKVTKSRSKKQLRVNGKFAKDNAASNGVPATVMPQIRVDRSIGDKSILLGDLPKTFALGKIYAKKYSDLHKHFKTLTEEGFAAWKKFVEFIIHNGFSEIFECKFVNPPDFQKLVFDKGFTEDKWEKVLQKLLSTGVRPEHNLFFRIPDFMEYAEKGKGKVATAEHSQHGRSFKKD